MTEHGRLEAIIAATEAETPGYYDVQGEPAEITAARQLLAEHEAKTRYQVDLEKIHVHDVAHDPIITPYDGRNGPDSDEQPETVDTSDVHCHDCGRELVREAVRGEADIFICPRLRGLRFRERPQLPTGAIECGEGAT